LDSEDNSNLTDEEINPIDNRLSDNPPPIQDTKPVTDPPPVVKDSKTTNDELVSGKFYLVYGSFSAKNGAEKARKMLENQGLEAKLLFLSAKNMYRVVIGEFNSYEEANNKKIALGNDFSQTWVLKGE
jgi:cell division protein FtsN